MSDSVCFLSLIFSILGSEMKHVIRLGSLLVLGLFWAMGTFAQPPQPQPKPSLLDADGNKLTDNEFVDLRLANRGAKDPGDEDYP
jgi:hypothetical protein